MYTTQVQLRAAFWDAVPNLRWRYVKGKRQNSYPADVRMAWVDFVDHMARSKEITEKLAHRATL